MDNVEEYINKYFKCEKKCKLPNECKDCIAALFIRCGAQLQKETDNNWQPIETAPKDGTFVILFDPKGAEVISSYWVDNGYWVNCKKPTKWQPLPEPPNES